MNKADDTGGAGRGRFVLLMRGGSLQREGRRIRSGPEGISDWDVGRDLGPEDSRSWGLREGRRLGRGGQEAAEALEA
jgi:hypothetical protein